MDSSGQVYHRKIISYLDGSLTHDDLAEFEAYVSTHPDFEVEIKRKQDELNLMKDLIPAARLTRSSHEGMLVELKSSIFNLLKEEPKSFSEKVKLGFEDWLNR